MGITLCITQPLFVFSHIVIIHSFFIQSIVLSCFLFDLSCAWIISLSSTLVLGFISLFRAVPLLATLVMSTSFFNAKFGLVLVPCDSVANSYESQHLLFLMAICLKNLKSHNNPDYSLFLHLLFYGDILHF
jgi:hypothetical protein